MTPSQVLPKHRLHRIRRKKASLLGLLLQILRQFKGDSHDVFRAPQPRRTAMLPPPPPALGRPGNASVHTGIVRQRRAKRTAPRFGMAPPGRDRRPPVGIVRERETRADSAAPYQRRFHSPRSLRHRLEKPAGMLSGGPTAIEQNARSDHRDHGQMARRVTRPWSTTIRRR